MDQRALEELLGEPVRSLSALGGGDINDAYLVQTASARVFMKTHAAPPPGMYTCEAEGLSWLAAANALPCPRVLAVSERMLLLEYVEPGARGRDFDVRLGRGLAALHRFGAPTFGFARDNFIANLPQRNSERGCFAEFYRDQRLLPMIEGLDAALRRRFDRLFAALGELIASEPPARLHGDLWSGNVHCTARGEPMLIDPAVYGGAREVDLAMLQLFGSPSRAFFDAYDEVYPRLPGHEERVALYQLYPLLVHVRLFGGSYLRSVQDALARIGF
ncbi:MAG TPA: fructosamine kinase family protein [Polyangiales bacterium]|nr:fructosamine kinase family protein [Polyangiales bacterium]